jgi:hypoxanthine phosphoribosyltransferase
LEPQSQISTPGIGVNAEFLPRNIEVSMLEKIEILFTEEQIQQRVNTLGQQIQTDYKDRELVLISVLRGAIFFMTDLARSIRLQLSMDFLSISSYGEGSEGVVRITKDLEDNIAGKEVLLVEDIVDTGFTVKYLLRSLMSRNPKSVEVCTLLDRKARRIIDLDLKYVGFEIPDKFVVGYGLDYKQQFRNLPYIGVVHPGKLPS